ncbi:hypothetical protein BJF85_09080 [Saccharomonospora sp. CUA-673]|nr:hypothetical protein BJF85_09080 [Saccharomonospora sp. CUA-673]
MPTNRRAVLRAAVLAVPTVAGLGAVAGCTDYDDSPDPLLPLLVRAKADADAAIAAGGPEARQVATVRQAHADALDEEIRRLNRPRPERMPRVPATVDDVAQLGNRLGEAQEQAAGLVGGLPRYRVGLVAAVAAGCAAARQLGPDLGGGHPDPLEGVDAARPDEEAVSALQDALSAEYAAEWVYDTVTAFLPAAYDNGLAAGADAHLDRRQACRRLIADAGSTPRAAEPAYQGAEQVSDEESAAELVVAAETDAASAWHGVLERTDDGPLREVAVQALIGSATRLTSWRLDAGVEPAAPPLPGRG